MSKKNDHRQALERHWLLGIRQLATSSRHRPLHLLPRWRSLVIGVTSLTTITVITLTIGSFWQQIPNWFQSTAAPIMNGVEAESGQLNGAIILDDSQASGNAYIQLAGNTSIISDPTVAAVGDIACGPLNLTEPCKHKEVADVITALNPNAVLVLGDIQYQHGQLADFLNYYDKSWGQFKDKTYPVVGNHEYESSSVAAGYFNYFNGIGQSTGRAGPTGLGYYSFNLGQWHIIALNSNCNFIRCDIQSPQAQWLRNDLQAHQGAACTLAMWHHPRYTSGYDTTIGQWVNALFQILYDHHVDIVLSGHSHDYERFSPQNNNGQADIMGVRQFVVGTGGKEYTSWGKTQPNSEARQNDHFGVLKLTLHSTSYDWQFMPIAGSDYTDTGYNQPCH